MNIYAKLVIIYWKYCSGNLFNIPFLVFCEISLAINKGCLPNFHPSKKKFIIH